MKIVLAISGGVDSMVMLQIFMQQMNNLQDKYSPSDIIVAHFDHGIRNNSALDAEFVRKEAQSYGCVFRLGQANLGSQTSEATARENRYKFLHNVAAEFADSGRPAPILTAHHLDDLAETVLINLLRGTGWRGLAVLDTPGIYRPFLEPRQFLGFQKYHNGWNKRAILRYAGENHITFREDQTNSSDEYLRNYLRHQMNNIDYGSTQIYQLWQKQKYLKHEIDTAVDKLLPAKDEAWLRKWFQELDHDKALALELLRAGTLRAGLPATRPQLENLRQAILAYKPGKYFNMPGDKLIKINEASFNL